uniref:BZIP domain-containing protein n=1 Tax=Phytophthora ramorum TaxID=164328 RepID=H3GHJ6_PHYRM
MDSCVLHPPNSLHLSDNVIGEVVQRAESARRKSVAGTYVMLDADATPSQTHGRPRKCQKKTRAQSAVPSNASSAVLAKHPQASGSNTQDAAMIELDVAQKTFLRALRRTRQIRYRKKKMDTIIHLGEDVRQLNQDIDKLKQRKRALSTVTPPKESVWSAAIEYFRVFHNGLQVSESSAEASMTAQPCIQLDFVRASMAPDVVSNSGCGEDAVIRSWQRISLWFQDIELEVGGLNKGTASGTLTAAATLSATITERTLRTVFPHVWGTRSASRELADKLLGQRVAMHGSVRFEWDTAFGRIARVASAYDMLTPMLALLGNLEDVAQVFEGSPISPDFQLRLAH